MREYGQVQSSFWQSVDAQAFSDVGKLLALYLLTGPHTNGIGCYKLPDGYVMADLGWNPETVSKGFAELSANGFANRFDGVVFIPNFLRWNRIANGNIATARFGEWEMLPKGEAKRLAARAMLEFCGHWSESQKKVLETVPQTVPQTVCQPEPNPTQPNPDPTQELRLTPLRVADEARHAVNGFQPIIDSYHEALPNCLRITVLNPKRKRRLATVRKLAKQVCESQGWKYDEPTFFAAYWGQCAEDPWMRGDVPNPHNPRWKQNLDVLLAEDRFANVMDRAIESMRGGA